MAKSVRLYNSRFWIPTSMQHGKVSTTLQFKILNSHINAAWQSQYDTTIQDSEFPRQCSMARSVRLYNSRFWIPMSMQHGKVSMTLQFKILNSHVNAAWQSQYDTTIQDSEFPCQCSMAKSVRLYNFRFWIPMSMQHGKVSTTLQFQILNSHVNAAWQSQYDSTIPDSEFPCQCSMAKSVRLYNSRFWIPMSMQHGKVSTTLQFQILNSHVNAAWQSQYDTAIPDSEFPCQCSMAKSVRLYNSRFWIPMSMQHGKVSTTLQFQILNSHVNAAWQSQYDSTIPDSEIPRQCSMAKSVRHYNSRFWIPMSMQHGKVSTTLQFQILNSHVKRLYNSRFWIPMSMQQCTALQFQILNSHVNAAWQSQAFQILNSQSMQHQSVRQDSEFPCQCSKAKSTLQFQILKIPMSMQPSKILARKHCIWCLAETSSALSVAKCAFPGQALVVHSVWQYVPFQVSTCSTLSVAICAFPGQALVVHSVWQYAPFQDRHL